MTIIDLSDQAAAIRGPRYRQGDRLSWRGHRFTVAGVSTPVPGYHQVTLCFLDRIGLPVSVPESDMADAVPA